jgi:hypothetical protein
MTIYLYKKTHNQTGLKYLGKTKKQDPHKYRGSGKYWQLHIKKHGYDVTTEILKECKLEEEIKYWGEYYSKLWNVVDDRSWANLKPESGDGFPEGNTPWNKGKQGLQTAWNKGKVGLPGHPCSEQNKEYYRSLYEKKPRPQTAKESMKRGWKKKYQSGYQVWNKGKTGVQIKEGLRCEFISLDGTIYGYATFKEGCEKHNLSRSAMCRVKNTDKTHKGWRAKTTD